MQLSRTTEVPQKETSSRQPAGRLADLPRRPFIEASSGDASLTQMRFVSFKVNYLRAVASFFRWLRLILNFLIHVVIDILIGKDSAGQRALRLRRAFEREGGSFIKLGIHLSMRLDVMPWAYCHELSCMTDRMKPFPVAHAI